MVEGLEARFVYFLTLLSDVFNLLEHVVAALEKRVDVIIWLLKCGVIAIAIEV